eukprot:gene4127-4373_t
MRMGRPGQPLDFTAVPVSEEAVQLTWMPPAYPINACIDKYRLDVMETSTGNRVHEVYINSDRHNTTIGSLKPGSKYRFTITSTAAAGSSLGAVMFTTMPLSNQQLTTEERSQAAADVGASVVANVPATSSTSTVTDVPATSQTSTSRTAYNPFGPEPINLRATAVNDTKLRISWTNSNPYICVDKYVVSGMNVKGNYPVFFATTNTTEVVAANLLPGRWYEFKVVAKNNAGDARSATVLTSIPE